MGPYSWKCATSRCGKLLRKLRIQTEETQQEMADKIGYAATALSRIERKRGLAMPIKMLTNLRVAYDLSDEEFLEFYKAREKDFMEYKEIREQKREAKKNG